MVARSNQDLQRVVDEMVADPDVLQVSTVIALATPIRYRVLPLVERRTRPRSHGEDGVRTR